MQSPVSTARVVMTLAQAIDISVAILAYMEYCQDEIVKASGTGGEAYWQRRLQRAQSAMDAWEAMEWQ